jgi:TolB-like protein
LNHITLAAVGLVVMLFVMDRFVLETPVATVTVADSVQSVDGATASAPLEAVPESPVEPDRGVAVLPFENLSEDPANAFFAGGVHEDVLTHLSRIGGLRIISRTSMIKIAERGLDVPEIGRQLGVSHVLEGSVRRAGDQVRVTVQLIEAATDNHLWAENFDRKLDDIFAIQSEIAQSIAAQLKTELSPEEISRIAQAPTDNLEAYDLYLKARELNRSWLGADGFDRQRVLLEQAVAMAPDFLDGPARIRKAFIGRKPRPWFFILKRPGRIGPRPGMPGLVMRIPSSVTMKQRWLDS